MQYLSIISHDDAFAPAASLFGEIAVWIKEISGCMAIRFSPRTRPCKEVSA